MNLAQLASRLPSQEEVAMGSKPLVSPLLRKIAIRNTKPLKAEVNPQITDLPQTEEAPQAVDPVASGEQVLLSVLARRYEPGPWDNYFKTNNTGMSFYDDMMDDKTIVSTGEGNFTKKDYYKKFKGKQGELMLNTPEEYFEESNKMHGGKMTDEEYKNAHTSSNLVKNYYRLSKSGSKAPLPVLDYVDNTQEGRHRAIVAKKLGLKEFPVLHVNKTNSKVESSLPIKYKRYYIEKRSDGKVQILNQRQDKVIGIYNDIEDAKSSIDV